MKDNMQMPIDNVAACVPVFNPESGLLGLCDSLLRMFGLVLVVDDGSCENQDLFKELPRAVVLLRHVKNLGKGRAIKTALAYLMNERPKVEFAVFSDGDGQHIPEDIFAVVKRALITSNTTLGVRDFAVAGVPWRSRLGNRCTALFVRLMFGYALADTQTGLRAVPRRLFPALVATRGERYEFEMRLFSLLKEEAEGIETIPIRTVYINSNRASHFRPIIDSLKVYSGLFSGAFFKFCGASLLGFLVDNLVFTGLILVLDTMTLTRNDTILIALILARITSSAVNYFCNRAMVFNSHEKISVSMFKYYSLVVMFACASYLGTAALSRYFDAFGIVITCLKVLVELLLFVVSYKLQRRWVFS